ncbi:exonuclease II Exo2 [Dispira simplex]|nr:exonuclease II Exo2 [Dispira simplex]
MGIPKFFYWMSQRYSLCSQLLEEGQIPEFDNMYLDMNGIIHNCSHPNDKGVHSSIPDHVLFQSIFNYVDVLFKKIRPKKLIFMAIDGVAPRAKMNQQRGRRFRTAQETDKAIASARASGVEIDRKSTFDSNCITPGTEFMERLTVYLKYLLARKVNEDPEWHGIQVVLSGHEVPGEGEHKIMEYIRLAKAQPDYDSNTRHCLYGLDADLIMLGLVSHEPHLALLREEIKFGDSDKGGSGLSQKGVPRFYLLHMSLLRDYLRLEFTHIRKKLRFKFDLERIIDDFILIFMLLGNDFVPHVPDLHIKENGVNFLFSTYKSVLPMLDDYLHKAGELNLVNFERFLRVLENHNFQAEKKQVASHPTPEALAALLEKCPPPQSASQSKLLSQLGKLALHRTTSQVVVDAPSPGDQFYVNQAVQALNLTALQDNDADPSKLRVMLHPPQKNTQEMLTNYYRSKLNIDYQDKPKVREIVGEYMRILQWVLHYYYRGLTSWGHFYPYHYAPSLSDLRDLDDIDLTFKLGKPFTPFEQLMGVLPVASRFLLPKAYHSLMVDTTSPISDFYPTQFGTDLNGKKQDWEALVLIPFIEEERLVRAMRTREHLLTEAERRRNTFGDTLIFSYSDRAQTTYPSPDRTHFADLLPNHCRIQNFYLPTLDNGKTLNFGLCQGARVGSAMLPGFPSLQTMSFSPMIVHRMARTFGMKSSVERITLKPIHRMVKEQWTPMEVALALVNRRVTVDWPYLREAKVVGVYHKGIRYTLSTHSTRPHSDQLVQTAVTVNEQEELQKWWKATRDKYSLERATLLESSQCLVQVVRLKGMAVDQGGWKRRCYQSPEQAEYVPLQTVINWLVYQDPRYVEGPAGDDLEHDVAVDTPVWFLVPTFYGVEATVCQKEAEGLSIKLKQYRWPTQYGYQSFIRKRNRLGHSNPWDTQLVRDETVAKALGVSIRLLNRICTSIEIGGAGKPKVNMGLHWRRNMAQQKQVEFITQQQDSWYFTQRGVQALQDYVSKFPRVIQHLQSHPDASGITAENFASPAEHQAYISSWAVFQQQWGLDNPRFVHFDVQGFNQTEVQQLSATVDNFLTNAGKRYLLPKHQSEMIVANVPFTSIVTSDSAPKRLAIQDMALGDRVVNLDPAGKAPLGATGYVVTLIQNVAGVLFEHTFTGANDLDGLCAEHRGAFIRCDYLLNLTNPQCTPKPSRYRKCETSATLPTTATAPAAAGIQQPARKAKNSGGYHKQASVQTKVPKPAAVCNKPSTVKLEPPVAPSAQPTTSNGPNDAVANLVSNLLLQKMVMGDRANKET